MAYKGKFKPKNPSKYIGDPTNIVYRSRWELKFMSYLDNHPSVLQWASEEFCVPYRSPLDDKIHRYFPDFYVKTKTPTGNIAEAVYEIKPYKQTQHPKRGKNERVYLNEVKTYVINKRKWEAAEAFCRSKGWAFSIVTEKDLGLKF